MSRWLPVLAVALSCLAACNESSDVERERPAPQEPSQPTRPFERVVVVSVDGLRPSDCARTPTLRKISSGGAFAAPPEGVIGVTPSMTYPSHASMVTGVYPRTHGITTNLAPDDSGGWRWYDEDIAADTVYAIAHRKGLRTALIGWPVTVGAEATYLLPEYWRAGTQDDVKLARALSTPGFLSEVARRDESFHQTYRPPDVADRPLMSAALVALERAQPALLFLHMFALDSVEHKHGPDSERAIKALEEADKQLARMLEALEKSVEWPRTALFVVSDHGFSVIDKQVLPKVHLKDAELEKRVMVLSSGAFAYFYLVTSNDTEAAERTQALFERLSPDPAQGIGKVLDRSAIEAQHGDAKAFLAIEAGPGFGIGKTGGKEAVVPSDNRGAHGYLPERLEMRASLMVYGPRIAPQAIQGAKLVDLAPTIAAMLGLDMPKTEGRPLALTLR